MEEEIKQLTEAFVKLHGMVEKLQKVVAEQGDIRGGIVHLRALVFLQDGKYQCLEEEIVNLKKRLSEVETN